MWRVATASGADSGAPRVAAREGGGRRGQLLLRSSYWQHGCYRRSDKRAGGSAPAGVASKWTQHRGNNWRDEAAVCAGGATTAGAARSPVCVCGPVRGGGGQHSCAAATTQSACRRPSARASTGRQGTDGGGGELGFRHPGATMVLGHLGRKPRRQ